MTPLPYSVFGTNVGMEYTTPEGYTEDEFREMMERLADSELNSADVARQIVESL